MHIIGVSKAAVPKPEAANLRITHTSNHYVLLDMQPTFPGSPSYVLHIMRVVC